jgi:FkbM family methyltransferase|tara:strand:- start:357 stop:983 length:627 start_codon:yes stop_codon:yes gene_type:complete
MDLKVLQIGSHIGKTENDPVFKSIKYNDNAIFVEPVPWLFEQLVKNYNEEYLNNSFIFLNKAVSSKNGKINLYVPSEKNDFSKYPVWASQLTSVYKNHIVNHTLINSDIKNLIVEKIKVETITLNEIILQFNIQNIELLHIDAEGHDYDILINLDLQLIRPKKIMFEHKHMDGTNQIGIKYKKLLEHLKENDYIFCFKSEDDTMVELL